MVVGLSLTGESRRVSEGVRDTRGAWVMVVMDKARRKGGSNPEWEADDDPRN